MTLQQLQYFLAAVEHGTFSAAAQSLHLAQPSLSEQIRRLEAELGVKLFARVGRRIELTEAGRELRPHAEQTLAAAQSAVDAVREAKAVTGGTVSFGMFGNAPWYLLSDMVRDFRARHPQVKVRVVGQNSSLVVEAVRAGELEAGLIVLPVDDRGMELRPVIRDEILYMSSDAERCREPVTAEVLARAPMILYDATFGWEDPTRKQLLERVQRAGLTLIPEIEVEDVEVALDLAARGQGDTLAPETIVRGRGLSRKLHTVSFDPPLYDTFAFIARRGAPLSPATRAFLEIAEQRLKSLNAAGPR